MLICWYGKGARECFRTTWRFALDQLVSNFCVWTKTLQKKADRRRSQSSSIGRCCVTFQPVFQSVPALQSVDGICSTQTSVTTVRLMQVWHDQRELNSKSLLGCREMSKVWGWVTQWWVLYQSETMLQCAASPKWSYLDWEGKCFQITGVSNCRCVYKDGEEQKQSVGGSLCMY